MEKYQPVSCELHSKLELAIMHHQLLQIRMRTNSGSEATLQIKPLDLITRNKEEYLKGMQSDETIIEIKLDRILEQITDI